MSENDLRYNCKKDLTSLLCSISENSMIYYFVMDELHKIIFTQPLWQPGCNLLSVYNLNMQEGKQLLERLLIIVAQYFQSHVSYSIIKTWLDDITQEVLSRLKNKYPAHSIFSTSSEKFFFWRDNNINDNFWNKKESTQILYNLQDFISSELIHKLHQLWIALDLDDTCVNYISEYFWSYLLNITYHSVARRLGIHCVLMPTDDPTPHILILWKPKYNTEDLENAEYLYISEESRDRLSIVRCIYNNELQLRPSNIWVTEWMVKKLNRALLCNSINRTWELNIPIQIINNERINIAKPIKVRSNIVRGKQPERNEKIKFAVGMIVTHSSDLYLYSRRHIHATNINHDGIIIGWHDKCWQMSINKSLDSMFPQLGNCDSYHHICTKSDSVDKPHCIILFENNKICYVQQDIISICPPKRINNIKIGLFFSSFDDTHYVPNEKLKRDYPSDTAAILRILSNK